MKRNSPIGVFDSGIGGLTVLQALMRRLPHEDFLYLGDNARVPYGNKSQTLVTQYAHEISRFLLKQNIKLLVVACNTASAHALGSLKKALPIPVVDVIEPACHELTKNPLLKTCGVLATQGTIQSEAYQTTLRRLNPSLQVQAIPCPLFVPFVEAGQINSAATRLIAKEYLKHLRQPVDAILLGCTHFPLLQPLLSEVLPEPLFLDSATPCAQAVHDLLKSENLLNDQKKRGTQHYFTTDDPILFAAMGRHTLQYTLIDVTAVDVVSLGQNRKGILPKPKRPPSRKRVSSLVHSQLPQ